MIHPRRGFIVMIGLAMLFAASVASADALPGPVVPDALFLDIVTAPGYLWMNGCGEMGAKKSQPVIQTLDLDVKYSLGAGAPAAAVAQAASDAHVGHHPGQAGATVPEALKVPSAIERELEELTQALAVFSNSLYWGK